MLKKVSSTSKRLNEIMRERNLKQADILAACEPYCDKYGIKMSKSTLSQYISGRNEPKQDKLTLLAKALNVDEAWLMGYDVSSGWSPEDITDLTSRIISDSETIELIKSYYSLDMGKRKIVKNFIEMIKKEDA